MSNSIYGPAIPLQTIVVSKHVIHIVTAEDEGSFGADDLFINATTEPWAPLLPS